MCLSNAYLITIASMMEVMAEKSDSVYYLSQPDCNIVYLSPAYETIWQRARSSVLLKESAWLDSIHPEDKHLFYPRHRMADYVESMGDKARFNEKFRIIRPDGTLRWIADRGFPVYDKDGVCCAVTGVATDVTEEKQYEEQLCAFKEAADVASELKSEIMRNVEDDICLPLRGIEGMANALLLTEQDAKRKVRLEDISVCAHALLNYCSDQLDFSQLENNSLPLRNEKFSIHAILKKISSINRPAAAHKQINLVVKCADNVPGFVIGDARRLQHILNNLVNNAIKFTHRGEVFVTVTLARSASCHEVMLAIIVQDTGIGIPIQHQARIFEKHERLLPSQYYSDRSLGLGLSIVKQFVTDMMGSLKLSSAPFKGSRFTCLIPFKAVMAY